MNFEYGNVASVNYLGVSLCVCVHLLSLLRCASLSLFLLSSCLLSKCAIDDGLSLSHIHCAAGCCYVENRIDPGQLNVYFLNLHRNSFNLLVTHSVRVFEQSTFIQCAVRIPQFPLHNN